MDWFSKAKQKLGADGLSPLNWASLFWYTLPSANRLHAFIFLCRTNPWVKYPRNSILFLNFETILYWYEIKAYFLKNLFLSYFFTILWATAALMSFQHFLKILQIYLNTLISTKIGKVFSDDFLGTFPNLGRYFFEISRTIVIFELSTALKSEKPSTRDETAVNYDFRMNYYLLLTISKKKIVIFWPRWLNLDSPLWLYCEYLLFACTYMGTYIVNLCNLLKKFKNLQRSIMPFLLYWMSTILRRNTKMGGRKKISNWSITECGRAAKTERGRSIGSNWYLFTTIFFFFFSNYLYFKRRQKYSLKLNSVFAECVLQIFEWQEGRNERLGV